MADLLNHTWTGNQLTDFAGSLALAIPDGGNVNFSGSMTAQTSNASVRANISVSQFAALAGGVSPTFSGTSVFTINVQPYTAEYYLNLGPVNANTDNATIAPLCSLTRIRQTGQRDAAPSATCHTPIHFQHAWPTVRRTQTDWENFLHCRWGHASRRVLGRRGDSEHHPANSRFANGAPGRPSHFHCYQWQ